MRYRERIILPNWRTEAAAAAIDNAVFPLVPPFPVRLQVGEMGRIQPVQKPFTTD
jgi:hypothetical protein